MFFAPSELYQPFLQSAGIFWLEQALGESVSLTAEKQVLAGENPRLTLNQDSFGQTTQIRQARI